MKEKTRTSRPSLPRRGGDPARRQEKPNSAGGHILMSEPNDQPRITWNESSCGTVYADVSNATATREEVALFFGTTIQGGVPAGETHVRLDRQILLSPRTAKRLAEALEDVLSARRPRLETTGNKGPHPPAGGSIPVGDPVSDELPLPTDERATLLIRSVRGLEVPFGLERSFKIGHKMLLSERFLVTLRKETIAGDAHARILEISRALGMPEPLEGLFREHLAAAHYVHFGFEKGARTTLIKAYLEYGEGWEQQLQDGPGSLDPFLLHQGFKWDPEDPHRHVLTRYVCTPAITYQEMGRRVASVFQSKESRPSYRMCLDLLGLAARKVPPRELLYLEVTEEGSPRRSFDINLYRAGLRIADLERPFLMLCDHLAVNPREFHRIFDPARGKRLGHVSGGTDREGRDFITVYYGVEAH